MLPPDTKRRADIHPYIHSFIPTNLGKTKTLIRKVIDRQREGERLKRIKIDTTYSREARALVITPFN